MIGLLHSETFRKNLSKWIFMYIAVMCLLTSVITYSRFISSFGNSDEARTSKFNVTIEPLATQTSCPDIDGSNPDEEQTPSSTAILCTTSRPTSMLEYYFKADISEIEVKSEVYLRARAGDENFKTMNDNFSNLIIENISICTDMTCQEFTKTETIGAKSGTITLGVDAKTENRQNVYYFKVIAKYDPDMFDKDDDGYIKFSSDENTPISDEVRIGFSAIQVD